MFLSQNTNNAYCSKYWTEILSSHTETAVQYFGHYVTIERVFDFSWKKNTHKKKVLIISTLTEPDTVGKKELHQVDLYAIRCLCAKNHFNRASHLLSCNKGLTMINYCFYT